MQNINFLFRRLSKTDSVAPPYSNISNISGSEYSPMNGTTGIIVQLAIVQLAIVQLAIVQLAIVKLVVV